MPPNSTSRLSSNSQDTFSLQTWLTDLQHSPTKIILVTSLTLHLLIVLCVLILCFKYRSLQQRFQRLKNSFTQELDDRKRETTKLHNYFNSTRPNTQSTSGAYFDDCYADQKLLPNGNGKPQRTPSSAESPKTGEASTPPTPLPRSKSKPEFQLNASNNNNVTEGTSEIAKPKPLAELNNNTDKNDSWFIPVTPATQRCKSTKPVVLHTPMTDRTKHNSGPNGRTLFADVDNSSGDASKSLNTSLNTSQNPMAAMSLWEQHESRPVLKHQT